MIQQAPSKNTSAVSNPARIVSSLGLTNGDFVADFGSGHGYYAVPLAKSVAPNGKVFAIDIQRHIQDIARARSALEQIHNIEYIWSDLEHPKGSKLKSEFIDLVLITNILHQAEHKEQIIKEAYRILMPNGRLVIIEWQAQNSKDFGPPQDTRVAQKIALNLCTDQSFSLEKNFDAGHDHYGMIFIKKI